tara:strand:- start:18259 stop:21558 length:3300 start_codon:yes stop_codon:yes gene_type:complete
MAEQTFKSPGFFEKEIDASSREVELTGIPAGIAGTAQMGPAFVPVTVGSFIDFENRFGSVEPDKFGPYAVREFLKHRTAVTYIRVLGLGANSTATDFTSTAVAGTAKGAGFALEGATGAYNQPSATSAFWPARSDGAVQFLCARHTPPAAEATGFPSISDNDSTGVSSGWDTKANLLRGVLFTPTGSAFFVLGFASSSIDPNPQQTGPIATAIPNMSSSFNSNAMPSSDGYFKLMLSSSAGSSFAGDDGIAGVRIYTASLDPANDSYIAKILNTDPKRFQKEQHLLYLHFPIENEIAPVSTTKEAGGFGTIALLSGSQKMTTHAGVSQQFGKAFGRFDTRYTTPGTTFFISQPYGSIEYNLFRIEAISDGAFANTKFKISIKDIRKSSNPEDPYGTFTLEVRDFADSDTGKFVLESYPQCTLNPKDDDYIAKKIGDFKSYYHSDEIKDSEKKVLVSGKYPNQSARIRVVMGDQVELGNVPQEALPFGFRGVSVLKTHDTLTDYWKPIPNPGGSKIGSDGAPGIYVGTVSGSARMTGQFWSTGSLTYAAAAEPRNNPATGLTGSIVPPLPFTFKQTRGAVKSSPGFTGHPGLLEIVDSRYYWGVKCTRVPREADLTNAILQSNASSEINDIVANYSKFQGIKKLDTLVTGSGADLFNNNKFTLARVALYPTYAGSATDGEINARVVSVVTGTAKEHMIETAYIRNGYPDPDKSYVVSDGSRADRITFGTLMSLTSSLYFNKFVDYAKFTNIMYGGFDGLNILDSNMTKMNDKASSSDTGGYASGIAPDIGLISTANNLTLTGENNPAVAAYRAAARILTNEVTSRVNIIAIPGIKDSALTDYVNEQLKSYGKAFYVMDIPSYDADTKRIFDDSSNLPSVSKTVQQFDGRALDNNYSAAYFPDVTIDDPINNSIARVPSSVAVLGALSYNDSVAYPWFAPAGFNRAALGFVNNTKVRLNQADRDELYEARINPIATFPNAGFVIFGQKTLQLARSAFDRVNVRRLLIEVKRVVSDVANEVVFEQNTPETRAGFVARVTPLLANIQIQQGIDQFRVVMDSTNNTSNDVENNVLNGKIVLVPTRAVEFIAIDFVITNSGISFE